MVNEKTSDPKGKAPPARKRRWLRRLWRIWLWTVHILLVLFLLYALTPVGAYVSESLIENDPLAEADYIVVLGGNFARAVEAANLYRQGWAKKVIFSSTSENADALADVACAFGLPEEAVIVDRASFRTADHPRMVARLAGVRKGADRFLLVTSPYHTSRAKACFRKAGYKNVFVRGLSWHRAGSFGARRGARKGRIQDLPAVAHEYLAWCYYWLRGWI
jgi:uncharacterized SAM-binding protein YcdF (DUF218 family)